MRRPPFPQVKQSQPPRSSVLPHQKPAEPTTTADDQSTSVETTPVNGSRPAAPAETAATRDRSARANSSLGPQVKTLLLVLLLLLLSLLVAWTISPNWLASTDMETPESVPAAAPQMTLSLAGPVSRDAAGAFKVPVHLTLAAESDPWPQESDMDGMRVTVSDSDGTRLKPAGVVTLAGSTRPFSRTLQVTLPPSLRGQEVTLAVAIEQSEARLRLSLGGLPLFAIRPPEPDTRASINEDGVLRVVVNGSVDEKSDDYQFEWTLTAADTAGTVKESTLAGTAGTLQVQLAPDQLCADYTVTLLATGKDGRFTWSQPGQACRQSGQEVAPSEGES